MDETISWAALEQAFQEPFDPEDIQFLPKAPMNEDGKWTCLALPYADKRVYEDRLNSVAFGQWSTPPNPPFVAGNKLVIPVTVALYGVLHTDYGEAFLSSQTRKGEVREEENSATEAYSQGFRRACAQFRLGRYLYSLPKTRVPYNPDTRGIALSRDEKRQLVERLYHKAGLLAATPGTPIIVQASSVATPDHNIPASPYAQPSQHAQTSASTQETTDVRYISERDLEWVRRELNNNAAKISRICTYYKVQRLEALTRQQSIHLINYIFEQRPKGATSAQHTIEIAHS